MTANGSIRTEVAAGQPVTLEAVIEAPPGGGKVIAAAWSCEGDGDYTDAKQIDVPSARVHVSTTYTFAKPGTYFPTLRATAHRDGDAATPYARIQNIARARVVVE